MWYLDKNEEGDGIYDKQWEVHGLYMIQNEEGDGYR